MEPLGSDGGDVSSLTDVEEHLDDLRPHPGVRRFVLELAGSESVWSERRGSYVGLRARADEDDSVAIYVYKERVEVSLAPERARAYGEAISGSRLFSPTATTTHWVIPAALLASDDAMRAAREALVWRRTSVRPSPAPVRATRSPRPTRATKAAVPVKPVVVEV